MKLSKFFWEGLWLIQRQFMLVQDLIDNKFNHLEVLIMSKFQEVIEAISNNTVATNKVVASTQSVVEAVAINSARIQELIEQVQNGATDAEIAELLELSASNVSQLESVSTQLTTVSESLRQTNPLEPSPQPGEEPPVVEPEPTEPTEPGTPVAEPEPVVIPETPDTIVIEDSDAGADGTVNIDVPPGTVNVN